MGVGRAIAYYSAKGWAAFIPVADMSRYDLIVDDGERLIKVEVKTTTRTNGEISLRTKGGNSTWSGIVKYISTSDCDVVFVVNLNTGGEREYPATELAGRSSVVIK